MSVFVNQLIRTAACASLTVPGLYEGVQLLAKNAKGEIVPWSLDGVQWSNASTGVYVLGVLVRTLATTGLG